MRGGSPPRVRGKQQKGKRVSNAKRITPACAGKTVNRRDVQKLRGDHPRVCGENGYVRSDSPLQRGSPPRVRGKPPPAYPLKSWRRITPACAGKTDHRLVAFIVSRDHPRVCGENLFNSVKKTWLQGSPPRVRGKHIKSIGALNSVRITPACAGKTRTLRGSGDRREDHPRVCGENSCL